MEDSGFDSGDRVANFMVKDCADVQFSNFLSIPCVVFVSDGKVCDASWLIFESLACRGKLVLMKFRVFHNFRDLILPFYRRTQQNYGNNNNQQHSVESDNSSHENIVGRRSAKAKPVPRCDSIDDLVFKNPSLPVDHPSSDGSVKLQVPIGAAKKSHHNDHNKQISNIRGLQRKLEQKVERAKKSFERANNSESENVR